MVRTLASDRRLVTALWLLAAYLLILYVAFRCGNPPAARFPGSD
jgi:hypothetical protein